MTPPVRPAPRLRVTVVGGRGLPEVRGLGPWLAASAPARARGTLAIKIVTDAEMTRLNGEFRGKAEPTDVLSFPTGDSDRMRQGKARDSKELGDVAIARGVAARQARDHGHSLRTELRILALHGLLHLLGYDHERDRGEMRAAEGRLRRRAGLPAGLVERASSRPRQRR